MASNYEKRLGDIAKLKHESSGRGEKALAEGIAIERKRAENPHRDALKPRDGNDESANNAARVWAHADSVEMKRRVTREGKK